MLKAIQVPRVTHLYRVGAVLPFLVMLALLAPPASSQDPNILVIVVDDLGIEHVKDYNIGTEGFVPLEALQSRLDDENGDNWLRVGRAWSNPLCSPTRSTILTGRYGRTTGTGENIVYTANAHILDVDDADLLPKNLTGYETAGFGKWHLGVEHGGGDDNEPITAGFDYFEGTFIRRNGYVHNDGDIYVDYRWTTLDGSGNPDAEMERICAETAQVGACDVVDSDTYLTIDALAAAKTWIEDSGRTEPWFAYVAFTAPHKPWNCPPAGAYVGDIFDGCDTGGPTPDTLDAYRGMMQIVDEQLDDLLESTAIDMTPDSGDTYVFFLSDNGSPGDNLLALAPFDDEAEVKGTVFEGGVRVPFFVAGPDVEDGSLDPELFINVSDLYATILELSGETSNPNDEYWERNQSQSFVDYMTESSPTRIRDCAFTEFFSPNGIGGAKNPDNKAIVGTNTVDPDDVYKYVTIGNGTSIALYNLSDDFDEGTNLCDPSCDQDGEDIIDELLECADQFRDTSCQDGELGDPCGVLDPCCPGLTCPGTTCVDPI